MAIAAVTCYFNPQGYQRLANNYWKFRENLTGIELVTVELSFNDQFMIPDAIQLRGGEQNIMWQKERLLNIGIESLPPDVDQVIWIDADVIFLTPDWLQETRRALDTYPVVQMFHRWHFLDADGNTSRTDLGHVFNRKNYPEKRGWLGASGGSWAARREVIPEGLEDRHVLGGSDGMMLFAWEANFNEILMRHLSTEWRHSYIKWAARAYQRVQGRIGYVPVEMTHLYHGQRKNRNYIGRWRYLTDYDYDPEKDIELDVNGLWKWASDKPEMHRLVKEYFAERREDD